MDGEAENTPHYYRRRAKQMQLQAEAATSEEMRRACLALAADWARLADMAEKTAEAKKD